MKPDIPAVYFSLVIQAFLEMFRIDLGNLPSGLHCEERISFRVLSFFFESILYMYMTHWGRPVQNPAHIPLVSYVCLRLGMLGVGVVQDTAGRQLERKRKAKILLW